MGSILQTVVTIMILSSSSNSSLALLILSTTLLLQSVYSRPRQREGTRTVINGLEIETLKKGDGVTFPKQGQSVTCHYTLTLTDGRKIDSSRERNKPFTFNIGQGVAKMSKGERAKLTMSPALGYGKGGVPGYIPPNAVLVFDVELLSISK